MYLNVTQANYCGSERQGNMNLSTYSGSQKLLTPTVLPPTIRTERNAKFSTVFCRFCERLDKEWKKTFAARVAKPFIFRILGLILQALPHGTGRFATIRKIPSAMRTFYPWLYWGQVAHPVDCGLWTDSSEEGSAAGRRQILHLTDL